MRRIVFVLAGVAVLAVLGWKTWRAEALIASGAEVLLELAPVDPRSMMQGDYMALAWRIERETVAIPPAGATAVLALDARRVGTFVRLAEGERPGPGEIAFHLARHPRDDGPMVAPQSFLFQEGHGADYARARYGIFRVDVGGEHLLVGLADADGRRIEPK